ncbi:MAG: response regulator [Endomicrobiales bacterium]
MEQNRNAITLPKARILVTDDDSGIRQLLTCEFERLGYAVDAAFNGEEALEKLQQSKYDIIITDIKMPHVDGIQVLNAVKKSSPETEVIMVTGYATVENAVQAMKDGAYDFIQKPFNLDELGALVEKALEKSEMKTLIALYESSRAIFSSLKLEDLFPIMIGLLKKVIGADQVALQLIDSQGQFYVAAASFSLVYYPHKDDYTILSERLLAAERFNEAPIVLRTLQSGDPLMEGLFTGSDSVRLVAHPIKLKNRNLGILYLERGKNKAEFSSVSLRNLSIFVSQLAQSITNTQLYDKLALKISELEEMKKMFVAQDPTDSSREIDC